MPRVQTLLSMVSDSCSRMEQSRTRAQFYCSDGSACTLLLKMDQRRQRDRGERRAGRLQEGEKKTKQGRRHWMTTSTCPNELLSLRAKILFKEAGKEGKRERERDKDGHREPQWPVWWQDPPCISRFPLPRYHHHHGQHATLVFIHLWGVLSSFVVIQWVLLS